MSSFIRRHRRKLIWGGAAVGGLVIAARIVERQMIKSREEEGRLALEKVRKQNHFESTESTCNSTLAHILHQLKLQILLEYQTNTLTDTLRRGPSGDEKVRIWEQIKMISFCRTSAYIISFSFIGVLLRVQLNVLAGHLFTTRVSVSSLLNNNRF
ncbi:peroxisomal biogenesis factor 3-like [Eurytemora carolleeae]|uniref:peroxisomal biogenesis factor 3-like n=1 Tax=Eurytemora carolleeae TaxID=1294199 RepID=UPI000C768FA3|nr:peroxisomal biogenesis factor 3-like [Eurytemora carolleeae]|eukprot:XP_023346748.1 peroxisomal biogenesis factor 3-like [Eurytemora affinis]